MSDFRTKQKWRKILYSKVTIIALVVLVGSMLINTWEVYQKQRHARAIAEETRTEYDALQERYDFLSGEIARLNTDSGVEQEIRERYGVAKPGERVIILVDENGDQTHSATSTAGQSFWNRIKSIFTRD